VAKQDSCLNISDVHRAVHLPLGSTVAASPLCQLQLSEKEKGERKGLTTVQGSIKYTAEKPFNSLKNHIASGVDSTEV